MPKNKKILIAQMTCVLSVVPALIWAHEYGPDPFHTQAPGEDSCIEAQCHVGTLNSFSGNVSISTSDCSTYTPGQTQRVTVTITDPTRKSWGFQISARLASDPEHSQAGDFNSLDSTTQVLCADSSPKSAGKPCSSAFPLEFAEHTLTGWSKSNGNLGKYSYQVDWTAPETNIGDVILYVSANASVGNKNPRDGHIYTASLKLSALVDNGAKPAIASSGGVVNGATNLPSGIAPNTYITIFGSNLAAVSPGRAWAGCDFGTSGTKLPTSLSGTTVTVNGKPAYVEYVSPSQINAITPSDSAAGSGVAVQVSRNGQTSDVATVTLSPIAPGFFTFDGKYVAAADAVTNALIGKNGLFSASPNLTTPAKPGETVTLYGTGFGPTSPVIADGQITDKIYNLSPTPAINIGGSPAAVGFAALTPGFAQVYQFNVTIPASAPDGDLKIFAQTNNVLSPNGDACCYITVKK